MGALGELESYGKVYFNRVEDKLRMFMEIRNPVDYFVQESQSQQKLKKYFNQLL